MATINVRCKSCKWVGPMSLKEDEKPKEILCPNCGAFRIEKYN